MQHPRAVVFPWVTDIETTVLEAQATVPQGKVWYGDNATSNSPQSKQMTIASPKARWFSIPAIFLLSPLPWVLCIELAVNFKAFRNKEMFRKRFNDSDKCNGATAPFVESPALVRPLDSFPWMELQKWQLSETVCNGLGNGMNTTLKTTS